MVIPLEFLSYVIGYMLVGAVLIVISDYNRERLIEKHRKGIPLTETERKKVVRYLSNKVSYRMMPFYQKVAYWLLLLTIWFPCFLFMLVKTLKKGR